MRDETFIRPVVILSLARLIVCAAAFTVISVKEPVSPQYFIPMFKILLFTGAVASVLFLFSLLVLKRLRVVLIIQLAFDLLLTTFTVYFTGGLASPFIFLYSVSTVLASVWLSPTGGITYASTSTVTMASIFVLYSQALNKKFSLPFVPQEVLSLSTTDWLPRLVLNSGVLFVIAILSGQLTRTSRHLSLFYAPILENIGEGVLALDHNNRLVFVNGEFINLLDIKGEPHSFVGESIDKLLERAEHLPLKNLLKKNVSETTEIEILREGKRKSIEVRISFLPSKQKRFRGKVVLLIDTTARKEVEEAKRRAQQLSELEEVSIGLAHELRNPLASIRGSAQQLERVEPSHPQYKGLMRIIQRESDRLDNIVDKFMHLARPQPISPSRVDIKTLLEETAGLLRARPEAAGVEIDLKAPRIICHCDYEKIKQVFLNIGINALEALSGKGKLSIEAKEIQNLEEEKQSEPLKDGVVVVFSDTGSGIRAKDLPRIFTPFFTTKPNGIGIGLAIANKIVAEHGGVITVDSSFGKGSVFKVYLPRVARVNFLEGAREYGWRQTEGFGR
ncbi:MAG: ATP-binding protein [Planctomycetota bacterium]|nr:ATP-binding protein [Planctomycetota bacterium]